MTDVSRRSFFRLAAGAAAIGVTAGPVGAVARLVEDPLGGWIPCDGRMLPRSAFPDLFRILGDSYKKYTMVPSDQFCVPDYRGVYLAPTPVGIINKVNGDVVRTMFSIKARPDESDGHPVGILMETWVP